MTQTGRPASLLDMGGAKPVGFETETKRPVEPRGDSEPPEAQVVKPGCQEKPRSVETWAPVPQSDTGRWVEKTKATGRTLVKELGNMTP